MVGMDMKKNRKIRGGLPKCSKKKNDPLKERIILSLKKGGFLPFLLPLLRALGVASGGTASIAKAGNDWKESE